MTIEVGWAPFSLDAVRGLFRCSTRCRASPQKETSPASVTRAVTNARRPVAGARPVPTHAACIGSVVIATVCGATRIFPSSCGGDWTAWFGGMPLASSRREKGGQSCGQPGSSESYSSRSVSSCSRPTGSATRRSAIAPTLAHCRSQQRKKGSCRQRPALLHWSRVWSWSSSDAADQSDCSRRPALGLRRAHRLLSARQMI